MDEHGLPENPYNRYAWIFGNPEIGDRVWIGAFCLIDAGYDSLKIGRGTDISSGAQILTHSTMRRCISERRFNQVDHAPVNIGDFCFIGSNAVILMGASIGHHSVIAAGAVVTQGMKIPPYSVVAGIPAKVIGSSKVYLKGLESESISVVIPAYNEDETIESVVQDAEKSLKRIISDYEIVLVDDGSTDETGKKIDLMAKKNKKIKAVHHKINKGFTGAMKTSFQSASKNLVFLAPADGQFDFNELNFFIDAIKGYDVALGYRIENKEDFIRKLNSRIFHLLCRSLLDINFREISTVSMWRRSVIQSLASNSHERSAMFLPEIIHMAVRKKYKFAEVPIHWYTRKGGRPKGANPTVIVKTFLGLLKFGYEQKFSK